MISLLKILAESPDYLPPHTLSTAGIYIPDGIDWQDGISFGYYRSSYYKDGTSLPEGNVLLVARKIQGPRNITHQELGIAENNTADIDTAKETDRYSLYYSGRLWDREKIISFWKYPDRNMFAKVIKDLNDNSGGQFHIDNTWFIEVSEASYSRANIRTRQTGSRLQSDPNEPTGRETSKFVPPTKLVPISEFVGSEDQVGGEHQKSPLLKKKKEVPQGVGSKKAVAGQQQNEPPVQARFRKDKGIAETKKDQVITKKI